MHIIRTLKVRPGRKINNMCIELNYSFNGKGMILAERLPDFGVLVFGCCMAGMI